MGRRSRWGRRPRSRNATEKLQPGGGTERNDVRKGNTGKDGPASLKPSQCRCGCRHPESRWTCNGGNGCRTENSGSFGAAFEGLVAGIFEDHLPHLVCEFVPIANVVSGAGIGHGFGTFFFEDFENVQSVCARRFWLQRGVCRKRGGDTIEFTIDVDSDLLSPLDLTLSTCEDQIMTFVPSSG
jgi:hypothetical protein